MGRKRREVLKEPATEEEETKFADILRDIRESVKIAKDVAVSKDKASKEKFIQQFLAEANFILDTAMELAVDDKITFSFHDLELQFLGENDDQPSLVHPDTEKLADLEARQERAWDSSDCGPDY